jgi:hypothetical protein
MIPQHAVKPYVLRDFSAFLGESAGHLPSGLAAVILAALSTPPGGSAGAALKAAV